MRIRLIVVGVALVAAACGGTGAESQPSAPSVAPASSSAAPTAPSSNSTPPASSTTVAAGPAAPDFTTVLSDGTEFRLSAQEKPIYMVFWAEW